MAGGFGDMSKRIPSEALDLTPEQRAFQLVFEAAVWKIFPDSTASRLARACGGVNIRTAQKWLSHQITPPPDVVSFVNAQVAELEKTEYVARLEALIEEGTGELDPETVAAQLAKTYKNVVGQKIQ